MRANASVMAAAMSTMSAAAVSAAALHMAPTTGPSHRSTIEVFDMAAEVVMFFPRVMVLEIRVIAPIPPSVRRVSGCRIIRVAVVIARTAVASVEASAERAGAYYQYEERLN
jgi:hypothetical protein